MPADSIFLKGLAFYGYHGVHEEETRLGQRFELDIDARCDLRAAGRSDDLSHTVSYSDLFTLAREVVEGPPKALIEAVAEEIAARALIEFPLLEAISVEIRKPSAPVRTGAIDYAGVRILRSREDS